MRLKKTLIIIQVSLIILILNTNSIMSMNQQETHITIDWEQTVKTDDGELTNTVIKTNDSSFIIAGNYKATSSSEKDAFFVKIDSLGNQIWNKSFGGPADDRI